ncbi:hypothetical protein B0H14DRAFT_2652976 [Mycena olivaceomarginata]|nr:hypothetical protein B0H14DRAFT_2652976 [Mycena olivaceomarginata]
MSPGGQLSDEICPGCNTYRLTLPIKATGFYTPGNKDRYYQMCSRNDFTNHAACRQFIFNDEVQRAFDAGLFNDGKSSPGVAPVLVRVASSTAFSSPTTRRAATRPCANTSKSCTHPRHASCGQAFCKACCQLSASHCPAPGHNASDIVPLNSFTLGSPGTPPTPSSSQPVRVLLTPTKSFVPAKAYAHPIDPAYGSKLAAGDFKATLHMLDVHWWGTSQDPAELFRISAVNFPFFHPRDSNAITAIVSDPNKINNFAYWDGGRWLRTDAPVLVKLNVPLYLRASNVTTCVDGPTAKRKISLELDSDDSPSPQRARIERPAKISPLVYFADAQIIDLTSDEDVPPAHIKTEHGLLSLPLMHPMPKTPKNATYYQNVAKWRSLDSEEQKMAVAKGRTAEGEWLHILKCKKDATARMLLTAQ